MKIIIFADLHISPATRPEEIQWLVSVFHEHNPDMALICGDFSDYGNMIASSELYTTAFRLFMQLDNLTKYGLRMVEGTPSHDGRQWRILNEIYNGRRVFDRVSVEEVQGFRIGFIPEIGNPSLDMNGTSETLIDQGKADLTIWHGVTDDLFWLKKREDLEYPPVSGSSRVFKLSELNRISPICFGGHIHSGRVKITDGRPTIMCGCVAPSNFKHDQRIIGGVWLYDTDTSKYRWIRNPESRWFEIIKLSPEIGDNSTLIEKLKSRINRLLDRRMLHESLLRIQVCFSHLQSEIETARDFQNRFSKTFRENIVLKLIQERSVRNEDPESEEMALERLEATRNILAETPERYIWRKLSEKYPSLSPQNLTDILENPDSSESEKLFYRLSNPDDVTY